MTQIYKVIKPVEIGGKPYRLGEEVALKAREAEELMQKGYLANTRNGFPDTAVADAKNQNKEPEQSREPDLADPKDKAMVDESDARAKEKHDAIKAGEAEKDAAKDEREAKKDDVLKAKRDEALALAGELGREDTEAIAAMGEDQLDKEIADMKGAQASDAKEDAKKPKTDSPTETKTK